MNTQPLWLYRWVPGVSLKLSAVIQNGQTLVGPVSVGARGGVR